MTDNVLLDERLFKNTLISGEKGRPSNLGSITYWLRRLLAENNGKRAQDIAIALLDVGAKGSIPHISMVLERTDGAIASEVNIKGVMLHVGDEYAGLGLAAMRQQLQEYGNMPQNAKELPLLPQTGIQLSPGENDPIKNDNT